MNNLSLLLYFADVTYRVIDLSFVVIIGGWIFYFFYMLASSLWADSVWSSDSEAIRKKKLAYQERSVLPPKKWVILTVLAFFLLTLVPNKDTLYMIAASEVGEVVVQTDEAKKIMSDVKEIISIQLENLKKKD